KPMKRFLAVMAFAVSFTALADIDWARFEQKNDSMPESGVFREQKVQHTSKRTLIPLTMSEKRELGLDTRAYILANFWHRNNYYLVEIPGVKISALGTSIY